MSNNPVHMPSGYATAFAVGLADPQGNLVLVDGANPLPVTIEGTIQTAAAGNTVQSAAPLAGNATGDKLAGPY